jgi:hypothetical protein
MKILSEGSEYYSDIINQHNHRQSTSLSVSNEIIFHSIDQQFEPSTKDQNDNLKNNHKLHQNFFRL